MFSRRAFLPALASMTMPGMASAQTGGVTRIIIGFSAGAGADAIARKIGMKLQAAIGSTVIVENIVGASGRLAVTQVKNAAPDGRTILITPATTITVLPHLYKNLGYDPLVDLIPVTSVASIQLGLMVGPKAEGVKTLADYVAWAKKLPGNQTYASPGAGSIAHFLGVMFSKAAGLDMVHVPYKGAAPAQQDLIGGQVPAYAGIVGRAMIAEHRAGRVKILAVAQSKRSSLLPDVPTFEEAGFPGVRANEWTGVFVPARTPTTTVEALNKHLVAALNTADVRHLLDEGAQEVAGNSVAAFNTQVRSEYAAWGPVVRSAGFKPDE